jgi:oligopeptide/dipeptide ABC transporter ATP-binding protein
LTDVLLDVRNVSKTFSVKGGMFTASKGVVHAVDDVSFQVYRGETFGLVGESGCGKSTLARTLLQLIPADKGEIFFDGKDLRNMKSKDLQKERLKMRMVFQNPFNSLNPRQTVRQIIGAPMLVYHINCDRQTLEKQVLSLMDKVELHAGYIDCYPHEFSGGQRQRIGIARALVLNPKLIICDEPVSSLDVSIQAQIMNLLKDLQAEYNLTYIFISHNLSVVKHMSNRIAVMYLGSIVESAKASDIYQKAMHPYTKALLSAISDLTIKNKRERIILTGDIPSPVNPPTGCRFCTRCMYATERCGQERPPLIEVEEDHRVACFLYEKEGRRV